MVSLSLYSKKNKYQNFILSLLFSLPIYTLSQKTEAATATCTGTVACPSGYTGIKTYQGTFNYPSNVGSSSQYCAWNPLRGNPAGDNRWKLISDTCAPIGPTFVSNQTENENVTCPSTQPSGTWNRSRSYELWSDGSHRNIGSWVNNIYTCSAIIQNTVAEIQNLNCPSTHPNGLWTQRRTYNLWTDGRITDISPWVNSSYSCEAIKLRIEYDYRTFSCATGQTGNYEQRRSYTIWSDGKKTDYSTWYISKNSCVSKPITLNPDRTGTCPIGYTGRIEYSWIERFNYVSYTIKDSEGNDITYSLKTPYQVEVGKINACKVIPTQTLETKTDTQVVSCDNYYNVASGTYSGSVYKYGTTTTQYDENTVKTTTTFTLTSTDVTSCKANINDISIVKELKDCPAGQTGSIEYYKYKNTDNLGNVTYTPNDWIVGHNSCINNDSSIDNNSLNTQTDSPDGLLSNVSTTSSRIKQSDDLYSYLNNLSLNSWTSSNTHKLIIEVENFSDYDSTKIERLINKFISVVGENNSMIEIKLPKTINNYIGVGGITEKNIKEKSLILKNIDINNNKIKIAYSELNKSFKNNTDDKYIDLKLINSEKIKNLKIN